MCLLGLSHISVNSSMTVNDTSLTNATVSRLDTPDPIDALDITVGPSDDLLDGCKVSRRSFQHFILICATRWRSYNSLLEYKKSIVL